MTTGRASVVLSECSSWRPRSSSSALALSSSTTARRTVHTLIGSYVAFSTCTRPPIAPSGDAPGPWRLALRATAPAEADGTAHAHFPRHRLTLSEVEGAREE